MGRGPFFPAIHRLDLPVRFLREFKGNADRCGTIFLSPGRFATGVGLTAAFFRHAQASRGVQHHAPCGLML